MIFALFSGLLGTAFSVLVRRCASFMFAELFSLYSFHIVTASSLVGSESCPMNLAYLLKAQSKRIQVTNPERAVVPMVKVLLLELYLESTSRKGLMHPCYRHYISIILILVRRIMKWDIAQIMRNNKREEGEPKGTIDIKLELRDHLRVKSSLTYGDGGPIVGIIPKGVRMFSSKVTREGSGFLPIELPRELTKLIDICRRHKDEFKVSDVYTLMFNMNLYEIAYLKLKSIPGNITPGIDEENLFWNSKGVFQEIINSMKDGSYRFKPERRTDIPKSNGKTRPLTIAPPRDKIVQEVMRMILEAIFDPTFSENSHGFRPNRSCHTALRQVKTQFGGGSFFIEGDISKCFHSLDHSHLIQLIKLRINDERFIRLIWKTIKSGYVEFNRTKLPIICTPQGSIISPLLSNIYLNELDKFIGELKVEFDKGVRAKVSSEYKHLDYLRQRALKNMEDPEALKFLKHMQKTKARLPNDPNFRRLYYVRYADE